MIGKYSYFCLLYDIHKGREKPTVWLVLFCLCDASGIAGAANAFLPLKYILNIRQLYLKYMTKISVCYL